MAPPLLGVAKKKKQLNTKTYIKKAEHRPTEFVVKSKAAERPGAEDRARRAAVLLRKENLIMEKEEMEFTKQLINAFGLVTRVVRMESKEAKNSMKAQEAVKKEMRGGMTT